METREMFAKGVRSGGGNARGLAARLVNRSEDEVSGLYIVAGFVSPAGALPARVGGRVARHLPPFTPARRLAARVPPMDAESASLPLREKASLVPDISLIDLLKLLLCSKKICLLK